MLIRLPYVIDLIKQTKNPERNLLAKTNIDTIAYDISIFNKKIQQNDNKESING